MQFINYKNILFIGCNLFLFYLIFHSILTLITTVIVNIKLYKYQRQQRLKNKLNHEYYVPISILLKSYNDEKKIIKVVKSLLKLNYKLYEIVIIDDGSTDKTVDVLIKTFSLKKIDYPIHRNLKTGKIKAIYQTNTSKVTITLVQKGHNGAADAFNAGINISNYPYFVSLDTSYTLFPNTLENLVRPILENDKVVISYGNIMIGSVTQGNYQFPVDIVSKGQVIEYNNVYFGIFKNYNIPMPSLVLFKKSIVIASSGYNHGCTLENYSLIFKIKEYYQLHKEEFVSRKAEEALATLEVPNKFSTYLKQRRQFSADILKYTFKTRYIYSVLKLIGILSLLFSYVFKLVSIPIILLFMGSYLLFNMCLSLYNFMIKLSFDKIHILPFDFFKTILSVMIESTVLKILLFISKLFPCKNK